MKNAVIISIGDELMLGQTTDTNSGWLSARLAESGVTAAYHLVLPDDQLVITQALQSASNAADLVIVSGGLGPTPDDLTRESLAAALGVELELYPPARIKLEAFFKKLGQPMPARNLTQAMLPRGAESLDNPAGTAPGIYARLGRADVFLVPGVPREMRAVFDLHIAPRVHKLPDRTILLTACLDTFGVGESLLAEKLGNLMRRDRNPMVGTTVGDGIVSVRIRADFPDPAQARLELGKTVQAIRHCLGAEIFGDGGVTLAEVTGRMLLQRHWRLVTVESCTGGLLGKMLTDAPGASAYYAGGWVVYANAMKTNQMGVPESMLEKEGAVSEAVARYLATAALQHTVQTDAQEADCALADCALAITGVAGPDGGTSAKPVGTVWIALSVRSQGEIKTLAKRFSFPGNRAMVRDRAAKAALNMLRQHLAAYTANPPPAVSL